MKKVPLKGLFSSAGSWAKENSPHILTAIGLTGMVGAIITAVKATPKAKELIAAAEEEKGEKLKPVEVVKTTWKCYILPGGCFVAGAACIVGADIKNAKINAGLATTVAAAETVLKTYQEKVIETLGEQEEKKVRQKAREEIAENHSVPPAAPYILGGERILCVDCLGNEYYADPDEIRRAINYLNKDLNDDLGSAYLNELYGYIPDARETLIGDRIGWDRCRDGLVDVSFEAGLKKDKPVLKVRYRPLPDYLTRERGDRE